MKSYLDLARRALQDSDMPTLSLQHYDEIRHYDINKTMEEREEDLRAAPAPAPPPAPALPPAAEAAATTETTKTTESVPPLEAAVRFDVPGVGDVWLVPDSAAADKLAIPAGRWLTPPDLALLEGLGPPERLEVLRWMRETGGRLVAAPAPARRYGPGEKGWQRWRLQDIDKQIREYHREKGDQK